MRIINSSFENVKFPTTLIVATVIPVHKNEDKQDKNDVAIANVIRNLLEQCIKQTFLKQTRYNFP